jgi:hypothetical protein
MAIRVSQELRRNLFELRRLHSALRRDTELALFEFSAAVERFNRGEVSIEEAGSWCKAAVRSFVAEVDSLGHAMRRAVLRSADEQLLSLSTRERARLSEKKYDATTDSIGEKEAPLFLEEGIKEAFKYFPGLFGSDYKLATGGEEWRGFKRVVDVRNQLTHPEIPEHLSAVNAYPALLPSVIWFYGQLAGLFADIVSRTGGSLPPSLPMVHNVPPFRDKTAPRHQFFSEEDEQLIKKSGYKTLEYVQLLFRLLAQDTIRALDLCRESFGSVKELKSSRGQFAFRLCLRTLFSEVQGYISAALFQLNAGEVRGTIHLTPGDQASLKEGALENRLVTAVTLWEREFGNDRLMPRSGPLWTALCAARVLRDKITHPKKVEDLAISLDDSETILSALEYLSDIGFLIPSKAKWALNGGSIKEAIQGAQSVSELEMD